MKTKDEFEKDYIKAMRKVAREVYGFETQKIHKSKKSYSRKDNNKIIREYLNGSE